MSRFKCLAGACCILLVWALFQLPSGTADVASRQTLSVDEAPDRIMLGWSGPVQAPMSERIGAALDRYQADPRRLVLILNSPGGSIEHGRKVAATMRAHDRAIDTLVENAGVCASMCVPIFLAGTRRMADPDAWFMFHQVSLNSSAKDKDNVKRQEASDSGKALVSQAVRTIEAQATDAFFRNELGLRGVNLIWLAGMRRKIADREIWISGQQLVDEGSGIVDGLVRKAGR